MRSWREGGCAHEKISPFVDFIDSSYNVCMNLMYVRLHTYYNIKLTTALSHNPYIHIHIYSTYIVHTYIHNFYIHTYIHFELIIDAFIAFTYILNTYIHILYTYLWSFWFLWNFVLSTKDSEWCLYCYQVRQGQPTGSDQAHSAGPSAILRPALFTSPQYIQQVLPYLKG
jgi:hypothetical protein